MNDYDYWYANLKRTC